MEPAVRGGDSCQDHPDYPQQHPPRSSPGRGQTASRRDLLNIYTFITSLQNVAKHPVRACCFHSSSATTFSWFPGCLVSFSSADRVSGLCLSETVGCCSFEFHKHMKSISLTSHESLQLLHIRKISLACGSDSINDALWKSVIWCQHLQSSISVLLQLIPHFPSSAGVLPDVADGADQHGRVSAAQVHRDKVFQARLPRLSLHHVHTNNDLRKNYTTPSVFVLFCFLSLIVRS